MPDRVQTVFGYALFQAQIGQKPDAAKPLKGFGYAHAVYVLHCFQKKSAKGAQTPKPDMALIRERLKAVDALARGITT
jgi:phage-related protein